MKMLLKQICFVIIAIISFISVFYAGGKFMVFLSLPFNIPNFHHDSTLWALLVDMLLLSLFMIQHTFMTLPKCKEIFEKFDLVIVSRSIYNLLTSLLLLVLVTYWKITSDFVIWNFDMDNTIVWFTFNIIHLFGWSVIYAGCLFMDITEILGIKQVYYSLRKMPDPISFKSHELQRLYGHMRHPSFSAFTLIFWIYPIMSLDRFVLASILTAYMYIAWKTDKYDLHYHRNQYLRKTRELSHLN